MVSQDLKFPVEYGRLDTTTKPGLRKTRMNGIDKSTATEVKYRKIVEKKTALLPEILKLRGLVKQHINSFDHFVTVDIKKIVAANREVRSDIMPSFFLRYTNIEVGTPEIQEESFTVNKKITPMQCRIRDLTYAAPIHVDIEYTYKKELKKSRIMIGKMPIMLRSCKCALSEKSMREQAQLKECPYDPGGYFIVRGFEKVILVQEQLCRNRILIDLDDKKEIQASVVSATHERKSRTQVIRKKGRIYLKHNKFSAEIPIVMAFKAMGLTSDQEFVTLIGSEPEILNALASSLQECIDCGIYTQTQALHYIGGYVRTSSMRFSRKRTREQEARDVLASVVIPHIPVER